MSEQPLEQTIGAILQDPAQMQSILTLARSLGLSPPDTVSPPPAPKQEVPAAPPAPKPPQESANETLGALLQKAGTLDRRQENLLNALKPFLRPERREKIDRAMQAARISRLAGAALRGREQKEP